MYHIIIRRKLIFELSLLDTRDCVSPINIDYCVRCTSYDKWSNVVVINLLHTLHTICFRIDYYYYDYNYYYYQGRIFLRWYKKKKNIAIKIKQFSFLFSPTRNRNARIISSEHRVIDV